MPGQTVKSKAVMDLVLGDYSLGLDYTKVGEVVYYNFYKDMKNIAHAPVPVTNYAVRLAYTGALEYWCPFSYQFSRTRAFWRVEHNFGEGFETFELAQCAAELNSRYEGFTHQVIMQCQVCKKFGIHDDNRRNPALFVCDQCQRMPRDVKATATHMACTACKENQIQVVFRPCGHLVTCFGCCNRTTQTTNLCPQCNAVIELWLPVKL